MNQDELGRISEQAAAFWQPITHAAGYTDGHPAADPAFHRELIEAHLDAMAERFRQQSEAVMAALPWPLRMYVRLRARLRHATGR